MAYCNFTLEDVRSQFKLSIGERDRIFADVQSVEPSPHLVEHLAENVPLALLIHTEMARSGMIVTPILIEVRRRLDRMIGLFNGREFNVDPAMGLTGVCDYLLTASPEQIIITAPVMVITEAKKDSITDGLGQCVAAMIAANQFNQAKGSPTDAIYGCVTTGTNWKFLRLRGSELAIDADEYHISQVERILGILFHILRPSATATIAV